MFLTNPNQILLCSQTQVSKHHFWNWLIFKLGKQTTPKRMFKVEVKNAAELNMLDKQWRNRNRKDLVEQEKLKLEKDLKVIFIA